MEKEKFQSDSGGGHKGIRCLQNVVLVKMKCSFIKLSTISVLYHFIIFRGHGVDSFTSLQQ